MLYTALSRKEVTALFNCFKTELKTILSLKSFYICATIVICVSTYYLINGFSSAALEIETLSTVIEEISAMVAGGTDVDYTAITDEARSIYTTYHPMMSINNSLGIFIGLGLITIPIITSFYSGIEYGHNRIIKLKSTHSSLIKTFICKISISGIAILVIILLYLIVASITSFLCWNSLETDLHNFKLVSYSDISFFGIWENIRLILLVWGIMFFYSMITMFLATMLRNSTFGIIGIVAINYVVLPWSFTPHNVIFQLIGKCLFVNNASTYRFVASFTNAPLDNVSTTVLFISYILISVVATLTVCKFQKNS